MGTYIRHANYALVFEFVEWNVMKYLYSSHLHFCLFLFKVVQRLLLQWMHEWKAFNGPFNITCHIRPFCQQEDMMMIWWKTPLNLAGTWIQTHNHWFTRAACCHWTMLAGSTTNCRTEANQMSQVYQNMNKIDIIWNILYSDYCDNWTFIGNLQCNFWTLKSNSLKLICFVIHWSFLSASTKYLISSHKT